MAEVKWIKIVTDIFDDEKIRLIETMPEGDALIVIWFKLLCLAGKCNAHGCIVLANKFPYTDEMLSVLFGRDIKVVRMALDVFTQFGMVEIINDSYVVANWEKHQNIDGMDAIREYNRKAQQKHRAMLKDGVNDKSMTSQLLSSGCQCTDKEKDKDKEEDGKNNTIAHQDERDRFKPHQLEQEFEQLWRLYPRKKGKEDAYKAYIKARRDGATYEEIEEGLQKMADEVRRKGTLEKFIPYGSTWFHQKRWNDEYSNPVDYEGEFDRLFGDDDETEDKGTFDLPF